MDIPDPLSPFVPIVKSPPAGLQGYIPYPHIAAVCMYELVVLLLHGHMWGSIGVHRKRSYISYIVRKSYYYYHYYFRIFPANVSFHWSLSDIQPSQVSRTLLSILADLNNEVWMVSTCPLIFKCSSPLTRPMENVPSAPIMIGITVTFAFHRLLLSSLRGFYTSPCSWFFIGVFLGFQDFLVSWLILEVLWSG